MPELKSNWIFTAKDLDKSRLNKLLSKFFDNEDNLRTDYQFAIIGMSAMTPENTKVEGYVQLKEGLRWSSASLQKHLDVSVQVFNSDDIVFGQEEAKKMNPDSIVQNIEKRSRKVKMGGEIRKRGSKAKELERGNNSISKRNQTGKKPKKRELSDDDSSCSTLSSLSNNGPAKKSKPKELHNDEKRYLSDDDSSCSSFSIMSNNRPANKSKSKKLYANDSSCSSLPSINNRRLAKTSKPKERTHHKKQKSEKKRRRVSSARERNSPVPKSGRRNGSSLSDEQPKQAAPRNAVQIPNSSARPTNTTCEMAEFMEEVRSEIRRIEACMVEFMEEVRSDTRNRNAAMTEMASIFKSLFGSARAVEAK